MHASIKSGAQTAPWALHKVVVGPLVVQDTLSDEFLLLGPSECLRYGQALLLQISLEADKV